MVQDRPTTSNMTWVVSSNPQNWAVTFSYSVAPSTLNSEMRWLQCHRHIATSNVFLREASSSLHGDIGLGLLLAWFLAVLFGNWTNLIADTETIDLSADA